MRYGDPVVFGVTEPKDRDDEIALLLDIPKLPKGDRWFDVCRGLEARGYELWELGARRLGYLGPFRPLTRAQADDYMYHAERLGRSAYPLLAHRASQLTAGLVRRALTVDRQTVIDLVANFFENEAPHIQSSGTRFWNLFDRYRQEDDRPLIVDAYLLLAEGAFRRFGSLLIAIAAIANRTPMPTPFPLQTVGDVENRLSSMDEPVAALLLEFVERELRNAGGHANVVLLGSGKLLVRLSDGTSTTMVANHIYGKTAGLRSALNGVDTAINLTHAREVFATQALTQKIGSIELLGSIGNVIANERPSGSIVRADAEESALSLHFRGIASPREVEAMLEDFGRIDLIDEIRTIKVVDESDTTLGVLDRASGKTSVP